MVISKMVPRKAPWTEPRPPITIIKSKSIDCNISNWSGEMNRSLCAYRAPAMPASAADKANDSVLACQMNAHALRRNLRVANGHEGASGGGAQQVEDAQRGQHRDQQTQKIEGLAGVQRQ